VTKIYAAIDPNWGEPVTLLSTIAETPAEAVAKAIFTDERGVQLYSDATFMTTPPRAGYWSRMYGHGYRIAEIEITIKEKLDV
jgi:hypothetical protein